LDSCYDSQFARVWADNHISGGVTVFWELAPTMQDDGPYRFSIAWGWTAAGSFYPVEVPAQFDTYFMDDPTRRLWGKDLEIYYKVRMETEGGTKLYESEPVRADGGMPKRDWLVARELTRNEYTLLLKGNGMSGRLIKRKKWGDGCECRDYDTGNPSRPGCIECFETGILGGYFAPVDFWVGASVQTTYHRRDKDRGMTNDEQMKVRCVPYPMPESKDIWVNLADGKRYEVEDVNVLSKVRQKPIAVEMTLSLLAFTNVAYQIDLAPAPPPSGSIILVDAYGGNRLVDSEGNVLVA
jgi:hypothetical protein